ncbi:MAG: ABC transporter ATP-binding protein [Flavobacterium sp.]|nr:MAG: ABC transporter ATP-binding protein [Flavobacterium sp.]
MEDIILKADRISKYFRDPVSVQVLKEVTFAIKKGEFVSVTGKSGCGKSTLLYILSTMDTEYDGDLWIDGSFTKGKSEAQLAKIRNEKIGFVFQFHYLLNEFSVLWNVMLPGLKAGANEKEVEHLAYEKLKILGIESHALKKPNQLSGGEKQRASIARALINDPVIIMADEPTGNLDKRNGEVVFDIFRELSSTNKQSLLFVTHDLEFAKRTDRIITMEDGRITKEF